jgi:hypothetical protein
MIRNRSIAFGLLVLLLISVGCAVFNREEKKKELLPVRNVKTVPFPVRPLEFGDLRARQEKDQFTVSGKVKNISYSPVVNVKVRAVILLAEDQSVRTLTLPVLPTLLQPGESGEFSATGIVEQPVSEVELHPEWEEYYPPGL